MTVGFKYSEILFSDFSNMNKHDQKFGSLQILWYIDKTILIPQHLSLNVATQPKSHREYAVRQDFEAAAVDAGNA